MESPTVYISGQYVAFSEIAFQTERFSGAKAHGNRG